MNKKDSRLNIRVRTEQTERLSEASEILDVPASQIIREAIDEKLARLAKRHPELLQEQAVA